MNAPTHPPAAIENILALRPQIAELAGVIEQQRCLPDELVQQLKSHGAFRALLPVQFGGLQCRYEDYIEMVQKLAAVDASTAWCVNQGAVIALTSLWLPAATINKIWAAQDTSVANGPPFDCAISPTEDGYELTGRWGFSSGCQHATWMMGAARCTTGGWRIAYFQPEQVHFTDNWQVPGLRGTGSFEFQAQQMAVPADQVADMAAPATVAMDMTQVPSGLLFACSFAALALGVAEGALQDVITIAQGKKPRYASVNLREQPDAQHFVGKATARWRGAHAYLYDTVARVLHSVRESQSISHDERGQLRLAGTHVIRECAEVVDLAYKVAGSTGIYQDELLQRRFQDMHVITQHVQAREAFFAMMGRYAISGEYETGPMT